MPTFYDNLKGESDALTALRRAFHRIPEVALQERRTALLIEQELDRMGIPHSRVGETGVLGVIRGAQPGTAAAALRADIDALAVTEERDSAYKSTLEGTMHACGHDAHITCVLGAARALMTARERFGGEVRLIFQPGEEIGAGAADFVAAGALAGVGRVYGLHCAPDLPAGKVGLKSGLNNAAVDMFTIRVMGKSAHISAPNLGADALYAACQIVSALQGLVTRRFPPVDPVIISVGMFHAGTVYNAICDFAQLRGTTRTVAYPVRMQARQWVEETAEKIAEISGARAQVIWRDNTCELVNDPDATQDARRAARTLGISFVEDRPLSLTGDNFSEYERHVPGCYAYLGTCNPDLPDTGNSLHNCRFDIDESVLPLGAALLAQCAYDWVCGDQR